MDLKDPITPSLITLVVAVIIIIIVFILWKPSFVVNAYDEKKKKINWGKLVSLSLVLGIVSAIVVYISIMKNIPAQRSLELEPAKMGFGKKVSDCY